ncbi:MAG: di-heme oxidoredictase family protein [Sphingobacteriaceae bacterium]
MRTTKVILLLIVFIALVHFACRKFDLNASSPNSDWLSASNQTVFDEGSGAFSHMFNGMPEYLKNVHEIGDQQFEATFVTAPAPHNPGLGPIYNNVSCGSCHISDGRGKIPGPGETAANTLFRISIPGQDEHGGPMPVPGFGTQLQTRGVIGIRPEADVRTSYTETAYSFADGSTYSLRSPQYDIINPYIPIPQVLLSARVAPPVFGLGLLEAVSDSDIEGRADPNDLDQDGISGKTNYVWNVVKQKKTLGRFGWKANQPSLLQQVAAAFNGDMGITNYLFPKESSDGQTQYVGPVVYPYELSDSLLHSVEFYTRTLAVPVRRKVNDQLIIQGKQLFISIGCAKCHVPDLKTAVNVAFSPISNLLIHPYTDLLLHDMGDGLADNRPDFDANGREWRTTPLWGIGLTEKVNGHTNFLHDGRARNLMEAILWHGGEAQNAKNKVRNLSKKDRDALISFLESL